MTHVVCDSIGLVACVHLVPRRKLGSAKLAASSQQRLLLTVAESVNKSTSNLYSAVLNLHFQFSKPCRIQKLAPRGAGSAEDEELHENDQERGALHVCAS